MNQSESFLSNEQLLEVFTLTKIATAIHVTEDAIIQTANDFMLRIWGKDKSVIGKKLADALPELKGQPFIDLFKKVWNEGITISGTDTPADLEINGKLLTFYFDYEYRAVKDEQGKVICILHTAIDVTERRLGAEREQALTEELKAANEELILSNKELNAINKELNESQQALKLLYENLAESNARFRSMITQAPVGICMLRAEDLYIQDVNDAYLELMGKTRDEMDGHTIWDALPEAAEVYAPVMKEVIRSGIPFFAKEQKLQVISRGVAETTFVDFVYEPIWHGDAINAIMVLGFEVTDKVNARETVQRLNEELERD